MRRLLARTIWAKGAIPPAETKYGTPLKRFVLPVFDLICVISGLFAVGSGIPAFEQTLPLVAAQVLGYLFAVVALVCFFGISFPHMWRVEIAGKLLLFALMGMYCSALIRLGDTGGSSRYFVAGLVAAAMCVPLLRLWILGTEIRDRRAAREVA